MSYMLTALSLIRDFGLSKLLRNGKDGAEANSYQRILAKLFAGIKPDSQFIKRYAAILSILILNPLVLKAEEAVKEPLGTPLPRAAKRSGRKENYSC